MLYATNTRKRQILFVLIAFCCIVIFYTWRQTAFRLWNDSVIRLPPSSVAPDPECGYFIRILVQGGLGNQMFAYATFYGMSKFACPKVSFLHTQNSTRNLRDAFDNLSIRHVMDDELGFTLSDFKKLGESRGCCTYDDSVFSHVIDQCNGTNYTIAGYRESFKYFVLHFAEIRNEFTFNQRIREEVNLTLARKLFEIGLKRRECVLVGVHIRRGDFTNPGKIEFGHLPASADYLDRAVGYFQDLFISCNLTNDAKQQRKRLVFVITGNDYKWNKEYTANYTEMDPGMASFIVMDHRSVKHPAEDMYMMSMCDHMIITTGTFGWWCGFLNRGIVTYQKEYARNGSNLFREYMPSDYFLDHWIPL